MLKRRRFSTPTMVFGRRQRNAKRKKGEEIVQYGGEFNTSFECSPASQRRGAQKLVIMCRLRLMILSRPSSIISIKLQYLLPSDPEHGKRFFRLLVVVLGRKYYLRVRASISFHPIFQVTFHGQTTGGERRLKYCARRGIFFI